MRTSLNRTRALLGVLVGAMMIGLAVPAAASPGGFTDIDDDHPFATEIAWMADQGITRGWDTEDGLEFRAHGKVTREAMAAFLYRYAGSPSFDAPSKPTFPDVTPSSSEFYAEVEWLVAQGITTGWSDGTFRPRSTVTRDAMASFLMRFAEGEAPGGEPAFADSSGSEHAAAIEWLATTGVSQGWLNWRGRVYKPLLGINRDAMAAFLYRLEHGAAPVTAHAPVFEPTAKVHVTASELHLRTAPGWRSSIAFTARKNARMTFDGAREYGWQRVTVAGLTAWAPTEYLTTTPPSYGTRRVGIKPSKATFYDGPASDAASVMTIEQGERGRFYGIIADGRWLVKFRDTKMWVNGSDMNRAPTYKPEKALKKAHSQVGYRSPNWNHNKFNDWAGGTNPWCMVYQMWVMDEIGFPQGVPFELLYSDWAKEAMASGIVDTNVSAADLKPGMIVLVDWPPYYGPTHTGMVDHVEGSNVILVEGNTTDGTGDRTRGVFVRERRIVDMYGVFDPDEYARVHGF